MIRYAVMIALSLGVAGCGKHRGSPAVDVDTSVAVAGSDDPKPFTLACDGQVADGMGLVRGAVKFSLTIDASNSESLLSNSVANPASVLPPSFEGRNGDILKVTMNDRVVIADLNEVNRQDADHDRSPNGQVRRAGHERIVHQGRLDLDAEPEVLV